MEHEMNHREPRVLLLAACLLALAACPDDAVTPDQATAEQGVDGAGPDQKVAGDSNPADGSTDTALPDQTPPDATQPDLAPAICDKDCLKLSKYNCAKKAKGICVECTKAEHCVKNPWSLGPKCDTKAGYCICAADADCAKWTSGKKCIGTAPVKLCGCKADGDCPAPRKCIGYFATTNMKLCAMPCKSNKDCKDAASPLCDTASGRCQACLTDKDCASGYRLGDRCLTNAKGYKSCGCKADGDCKGNPHGPTCSLGARRCTCKADSECTTAPYTMCMKPFAGAAFAHCRKPCASASDCKPPLACMIGSKKCGQCLADSHCTDSKVPYCDLATSTCVSCKSDKQCTGSKKHCVPTYGQCKQCITSKHCTTASVPFCDPQYYHCFECTEDAHCKVAGKYTWGNKCYFNMFIGKICRCESNADCAGSPMGPTCFGSLMKCSCAKDADCKTAPYSKCFLPYPGAKYKRCQKPCKVDKDCDIGSAPRCHAASGVCGACLTGAHCQHGAAPLCDTKTLGCVGCKAVKDCALSRHGRACAGAKCSCAADKDCAADTWGSKCLSKSKRCGCEKAADCAKSTLGKVCDTKNSACGCATNSDCPAGKTCTGKSSAGTKICA